jgi:hypothetical protein
MDGAFQASVSGGSRLIGARTWTRSMSSVLGHRLALLSKNGPMTLICPIIANLLISEAR